MVITLAELDLGKPKLPNITACRLQKKKVMSKAKITTIVTFIRSLALIVRNRIRL
jgi:hypothetical protein